MTDPRSAHLDSLSRIRRGRLWDAYAADIGRPTPRADMTGCWVCRREFPAARPCDCEMPELVTAPDPLAGFSHESLSWIAAAVVASREADADAQERLA